MDFAASCMFGKETQLMAVNTRKYNPTKSLCFKQNKAKNNTSLNIFHRIYFQWNKDGLELINFCATNWLIEILILINSVYFIISDKSHVMKFSTWKASIISTSTEFDLQFKTARGIKCKLHAIVRFLNDKHNQSL